MKDQSYMSENNNKLYEKIKQKMNNVSYLTYNDDNSTTSLFPKSIKVSS